MDISQAGPPPGGATRQRPGWLAPAVLAMAAFSIASGLAQFGVTAVVGDVAEHYGAPGAGGDVTSQIGVTGTTLGIALALIRLASLGALPASSLADRVGRRRLLLITAGVGLTLTVLSAASWSFWSFVVIVALARPFLSSINSIGGVVAAEETSARDRAWAVAIVGGAYGVGAGIVAVARGVLPEGAFRPALLLSVLGLLAVPVLARLVKETQAFERSHPDHQLPADQPRLGAVDAAHWRELGLMAVLTGGIALATGPGVTYFFVYGENVLGRSPSTMSLIVLAAGPVGLVGLLSGRWASDHLGRRPAAAGAMLLTAMATALSYSGSFPALVAGYLLAVTAAAAFGPPAGAMAAEVFPTKVRATAAGWLTAAGVAGAVFGLAAFGALVDRFDSFGTAATTLAVPVLALTSVLIALPETRGRELQD